MANLYERLVAAGAPEIAEPRFYRIREEIGMGGRLVAEIRERLPRGGSRQLVRAYVDSGRADTMLDDTVETLKDLSERVKVGEMRAALVGDEIGPGM